MGKSIKSGYDAKRAMAVKAVAEKYQCTTSHVRACINGTWNGGNSDEIRKAYNQKYIKLTALIG
jgi:hypothetical protein